LLCSLQHILPSSPTTSFSLLWRAVSPLYETRATPGRVPNNRAVHQGQPRIKRGLCLALVGALELISAADWNILISLLNLGLGYSWPPNPPPCSGVLGVPPWAKRHPHPHCRALSDANGTFQSPGQPQEVAKRAWGFMGVVFVLLFIWLGAIVITFSEAP
jgi:hypothetical protein